MSRTGEPVLVVDRAEVAFGDRTLWSGLDLTVATGEFVVVLGANGAGKTTLLRAVLGLQPLRSGTLRINGRVPRRARHDIGYIPQDNSAVTSVPTRAGEVVAMGVDGHRWGPGFPSAHRRARVRDALQAADAESLAETPMSRLSGGEAQRIRVAQALATDPGLLLCDEPLVSLDLRRQREVAALVDRRRRERGTAVLFVTHEINPVLVHVDRVLYLAAHRYRLGTVDEVMTSESLSALYESPVEVLRYGDRILVAGLPDSPAGEHRAARGHR